MITCKNLKCRKMFYVKDKRQKFCSQSCAAITNNTLRSPPSDETKQKQKASLKQYYVQHPEKTNPSRNLRGPEYSKFIGSFTKGKFKGAFIESILSVSKRTASKILKRLNLGCSVCGWKDGACDIHHIEGKKVVHPDRHENLTLLCPNHHRLFHEKKISRLDVISLDKYFPNNWRDVYYG